MWMIIIVAIVTAIIFGAIGFADAGAKACVISATAGVVVGALIALATNGCVSTSYSYNHDNCTSSTEVFDLVPYVIEDETYYAYMDGNYNFSVEAQYITEKKQLCSVHINSVDSCKFDKATMPSVAITTYSPNPSEWILFPKSYREYQLLLPDKSVIYWGTK